MVQQMCKLQLCDISLNMSDSCLLNVSSKLLLGRQLLYLVDIIIRLVNS